MTDQPYLEYDPLSDTIHFHCEATETEVDIAQDSMLGVYGWNEGDFMHHNTLTKIRATQEGR